MVYTPESNQPNFNILQSTLVNSKIQRDNPALYQTISEIIKRINQFQGITVGKFLQLAEEIAAVQNTFIEINNSINNIDVIGTGSNLGYFSTLDDTERGEDGFPGIQGIPGIPGINGIQGVPGIGIDGIDGEDAYYQILGNLNQDSFPVVQTITSTGTVHDLALLPKCSLLRCNNSSLLTLTGFAGAYDGQILVVVSVGSANVNLAYETGSAAANQLKNMVTSGPTPLSAGSGVMVYQYDILTLKWRAIAHDQGHFITPPFSAGDFTSDLGGWTVDSGDISDLRYKLVGNIMTIMFAIYTTSVITTQPNVLKYLVPGGFSFPTTLTSVTASGRYYEGAAWNPLCIFAVGATDATHFHFGPVNAALWALTTNTTYIQAQTSVQIL